MNLHAEPSMIVTAAHIVLTLVLLRRLAQGVASAAQGDGAEPDRARRTVTLFTFALLGWLALTLVIARSGLLVDFEARPPRVMLLMVPALLITTILALTKFGAFLLRGLPLWKLVGYQAFRIPVELILWRLAFEKLVPERMTFSGWNFDIASGVSALFLSAALQRKLVPLWTVWIWNTVSLGLLLFVVQLAVRSMPGPLQSYTDQPANTIVLDTVFIWIPTLYVLAALFGHVLVFRALRQGKFS